MKNRLKRQQDFDLVFNKGKRAYTKKVAMYYCEAKPGNLKIGISVSKKHGNAVLRNRIKRLIRESFAKTSPLLSKSYSIIVLPRILEEYSFKNFEKSFLICFKKINASS